jgi:hypothetical protein
MAAKVANGPKEVGPYDSEVNEWSELLTNEQVNFKILISMFNLAAATFKLKISLKQELCIPPLGLLSRVRT